MPTRCVWPSGQYDCLRITLYQERDCRVILTVKSDKRGNSHFRLPNMPPSTCTYVPTSQNDTDYFQVLVFFTVLPEASFIGKLLVSGEHTHALKYIFMEAILQETVTNSVHCLQPESNIIIS